MYYYKNKKMEKEREKKFIFQIQQNHIMENIEFKLEKRILITKMDGNKASFS